MAQKIHLEQALRILRHPDAFFRYHWATGRKEIVDADNEVYALDGRTYSAPLGYSTRKQEFGSQSGRDLLIVYRLEP